MAPRIPSIPNVLQYVLVMLFKVTMAETDMDSGAKHCECCMFPYGLETWELTSLPTHMLVGTCMCELQQHHCEREWTVGTG